VTVYRAASVDDRRFVIGAWASSYKNSHFAGLIASEDWPAIMHRQIAKLLDRPGTRTIVAVDPPSFLYAFICGDTTYDLPIVHYCYVKGPYRSEEQPDGSRSGPRYARGLLAALGVDPARPFLYTCRTASSAQLADKIPLARFTPGAARYANYHQHQEQRTR